MKVKATSFLHANTTVETKPDPDLFPVVERFNYVVPRLTQLNIATLLGVLVP
jgi:hypothetical protein